MTNEPHRYRYADLVPGIKIAVFVERGTTHETLNAIPSEKISLLVNLLATEVINELERSPQ